MSSPNITTQKGPKTVNQSVRIYIHRGIVNSYFVSFNLRMAC
jgi:hypothetical protein